MPDDEHFFQIRFSDAAMDSILLAATEAYFLGDGSRLGTYVEIDGYLWGFYAHHGDDHTLVQVEKFAPAFSSKRSPRSVQPNESAAPLMNGVMAQLCPHLSFLGEVHTHPYDDLDDAREARGWFFSDEDRAWMSDPVWQLTGDEPPLWLVVAIAPLQRVRSTLPEELADGSGAWQFDLGNMRFWLNAEMVPEVLDDGSVRFAKNTYLDLVPRHFNPSGNRLGARPHGVE